MNFLKYIAVYVWLGIAPNILGFLFSTVEWWICVVPFWFLIPLHSSVKNEIEKKYLK